MIQKLACITLILSFYAKTTHSGGSTPGVQCVSDIAFTIIAEVFNNPVDIGVRLYCPVGHHCVSQSESPCHPNYYVAPSTTNPTTTSPRPKTTEIVPNVTTTEASSKNTTFLGDINCTGPGYYPAPNCNEYYECAPLFKWFKAVLSTCKEGYYFSEVNRPCSMPPNVVCTD